MSPTYQAVLNVVQKGLLALAMILGVVCIIDWAIRTRRISPFSAISRFFRRWIDPMLEPLERIIVRRGGQPAQAPFYAFMAVIVSGIILIQLMGVMFGLAMQMSVGMSSPRMFIMMLIAWTLRFLTIALIVRVVSSWLPVSPYSKWIRWSYVVTDWLIAPIRRVLPPFSGIDFSPLIAYFILMVAGNFLGI